MTKFKDFSIAKKLLTGFLSVVCIMLLVGGVGIFGMTRINQQDTYLYEVQTQPIGDLISAYEAIYQIRVDARDAIISSGDTALVAELQNTCLTNSQLFLDKTNIYRASISGSDSMALLDEAQKLFEESYMPMILEAIELAKQNKGPEAEEAISKANSSTETIFQNMSTLVDNRMESAKETSDANSSTALVLIGTMLAVIVLGAGVAVFLGLWISKSISKPIGRIVESADHIALGRVDVNLDDISSKDETGILAASFTRMLKGIHKQVQAAELISNGDFTHPVPLRSEDDAQGRALQKIQADLSNTLNLIRTSANQVNTGAEQVSTAAQALSSGATEQAATVEELTASAASVAEQATQNSLSVQKAIEFVGQSEQKVTASRDHMQRLNMTMQEIGQASQQISKITKLVEDIAFQTNILALNAAVEAARAGNAGKGFAVVADEVRNLAAKSAEAAKQTADLIQHSVTTISGGERLSTETQKLLDDVIDVSAMVAQSIREIEGASTEQAAAIEQINQGLSQVSAVIQTNAATAEESSASSEELAAQAQVLQGEISKFRLSDNQRYASAALNTGRLQESFEMADDADWGNAESRAALSSGFDKY